MVLINDKKFACATCIKGHRVSGCTHTDRPLFEVKKKGRPATQCQHCRDKRKNTPGVSGGQVHTKCNCGEAKLPNVIMPGTSTPSGPSTAETQIPPFQDLSQEFDPVFETRKGVPGTKATFPNGLKDVHDMAVAAETLSGMGTEDQSLKVAERKVANLLNPCHCQSGGICKCCQPKREKAESLRAPSPSSSGARTPTHSHSVTDGLVEMFKSKATTSTTPPEAPPRPSISTSSSSPTWAQLMQPRGTFLSPDNMHHPAHTSPHVHKTKLYSPYSTSGHSTPRHGRRGDVSPGSHRSGGWASLSSSSAARPAPPKLRPISDMNRLLGAVFRDDGTVAETIPRSALGLPGISAFDAMAQNGGVKIETMDMDVDMPIQFPTKEDVVIGACTCGEDCECSGCATHGNPPRSGFPEGHVHDHGCGENCKSSFDCSDHLSLPSGITSIGHLLSLAAANVPSPAHKRPFDLSGHAHDTRVLPPAVQHSEDAARALGVVTLKPLECCNGRCQCAPGKCTCEKECCGCCIRCACDEDGDSKMNGTKLTEHPASSSCCSTTPAVEKQVEASGFCCSTSSSSRHPSPARSGTATPPILSPNNVAQPASAMSTISATTRQASPHAQVGTSSATSLRRASSVASQSNSGSAAVARRATVTHGSGVHRSGSTGKQASKALALHAQAHHPHSTSHSTHTAHPRPILPKPPSSTGQLGVKSGQGSRMPSPNHGGPTAPPSAHPSRPASPAVQSQPTQRPQPPASAPPLIASGLPLGQSSISSTPTQAPFLPDQRFQNVFLPQERQPDPRPSAPTGFADFAADEDFMAFINQLQQGDSKMQHGAPSSSEGSVDLPLITPDISVDDHPFDRYSFSGTNDAGQSNAQFSDFDPDFLAMLDNAISTDNSSQGPILDVNPEMNSPTTQLNQFNLLDPSLSYPSNALLQSQAASTNTGLRSPLDLKNPSNTDDVGLALTLSDLFVKASHTEAAATSQATAAPPVYRQLPPQLQQALSQNPALSRSSNESKGQAPSAEASAGGSNMIDLSKPLNASDVERILRALQNQQANAPSPPSEALPPNAASNDGMGHRLSNASSISSSAFQRGMSLSNPPFPYQQPGKPPTQILGHNPSPQPAMPQSSSQGMAPLFDHATSDELLERYLNSNTEYFEDPSMGLLDPAPMPAWTNGPLDMGVGGQAWFASSGSE